MRQKGFALPVILLLVLSLLAGFLLGTRYKQNSNFNNTSSVDQLNKQVNEKEEEIQLLLENKAKLGQSSKSIYSYETFGVYSPLFKDKEVENTTYTYKRQNIIRKELILEQDNDKNSQAGVITWEYTNIRGENAFNFMPVIFGGYENLDIPTSIDLNAKNKETYSNPTNIKMVWNYEYCPKSVCIVTLDFFSQYTPTGHPIYVQIWANTPFTNNGVNSPEINQTKEKLKKIVQTVEDYSTRH